MLRVMGEHSLLSPHRARTRTDEPHDRKIITTAPNVMWVALLANVGPGVLTDFGPPPVPQPTVARLDRGAWRGLESQSRFV